MAGPAAQPIGLARRRGGGAERRGALNANRISMKHITRKWIGVKKYKGAAALNKWSEAELVNKKIN